MQFGAYASMSVGSGFYIDAILTSSFVYLDTRRSITFGSIDRQTKGDTESAQFGAALSLGREFKFGNFTFAPHAGIELSYLDIYGFAENGADSLDLGLADQSVKRFISELGAQLSYRMQISEGLTLIPELRVSMNSEMSDNGRTITARLEGGEGAAFNYVPSGRDRDGFSTSLGVSALRGDDWSASVYWNSHSMKRDGDSNSISLSLDYKF